MNEDQTKEHITVIEQDNYKCQICFNPGSKIQLTMIVYIGIFTRIYSQAYHNSNLPSHAAWIFQNIEGLYEYIQLQHKNKQKIVMHLDRGQIEINVNISINNKKPMMRSVCFKLQRRLQDQLNEIRLQLKDDEDLRRSVEHLWRREEENQKIFMKFREQIQYKIEEVSQRMNIQNTKISIMREDINRISLHIQNLTRVMCPLLAKININSIYLKQFFIQDKRITYAGSDGQWTQILLKNKINYGQKFQLSFRILSTKKNNIVVGLTKSNSVNIKSSLKKQNMIGYSAGGVLYKKTQQQKSGDGIKSMHPIKMIIDLAHDKIMWKNQSKLLSETDIAIQNQELSPCIFFVDPGDAIQIL